MQISLRILNNELDFKLNKKRFKIAAGQRQQMPLTLSVDVSKRESFSNKTPLIIEFIENKTKLPVNTISTSFFTPNIINLR